MATQKARRHRSTSWKTGIGLCLLALLLVGAGVGSYAWYLGLSWDHGRNTIEDPAVDRLLEDAAPAETDEDRGTPAAMNILVLGSDARSKAVDYTSARGFRTDTIMVVHLPADRDGIQILSIPRDSWVTIEGHGKAKINAAAAYGGLALTMSTVSDFIGAKIDHIAIVDFDGFEKLTDALGGVEVYSSEEFTNGEARFRAGLNKIDGVQALEFVRARKQFADGDLQRIRNQQEYLRAVGETLTGDVLTAPHRLAKTVKGFAPYLTVDKGLDARTIASVMLDYRGLPTADIDFFTAPISGAGVAADGQQYLLVDDEGQARMKRAFTNDTLADYAAETDDQHL
jgi:polyisoprenyl-teichoic acid--peptidoglycan teichoic acid transferase